MAPTGTGEEEHELQKEQSPDSYNSYLTTAQILALSPVMLPSLGCHAHLTAPQLFYRSRLVRDLGPVATDYWVRRRAPWILDSA